MKRVVSNKEVHIRNTEPWRKPHNLKGILNPGFEIEVEEIEGESIDNNRVWFRDKNGDYLWSGGFVKKEIETGNFFNYRELLKINGALPAAEGDSIRVAVLDTGIYLDHPDFEKNRISFANFIDPTQNVAHDNVGHGTHVAGLIGASSPDKIGINGVAPKSKLEVYKVIKDNLVPRGDKIKEVFNRLEQNPPHVINLSLSVAQAEYEELEASIERLFNAGCVMVAAGGNNEFLTTSILKPAISNKIISVGAIANSLLPVIKLNGLHQRLNFFFRNDAVSSAFIKPIFYKEMAECSMYTAIVSGLLASFLSSKPALTPALRFNACLEFLNSVSFQYKNVNELQHLTLYEAHH